MNSPAKIFYVPVYAKTEQLIRSSKIGEFIVPRTSRIDMGDVFGGGRTCILDYISHAGEIGVDDALYVMYVAKKKKKWVNSTSDGWECEYYPRCKVALLTEHKGADNASTLSKQPKCPFSHKRTRRNGFDRVCGRNQVEVEDGDSIFDMDDSDFPGDKSDSRNVGKLMGEEPDQSELIESGEWENSR